MSIVQFIRWLTNHLPIAMDLQSLSLRGAQRVRPVVAGPMPGSATKQSRAARDQGWIASLRSQ
jgi:hypothetical protein